MDIGLAIAIATVVFLLMLRFGDEMMDAAYFVSKIPRLLIEYFGGGSEHDRSAQTISSEKAVGEDSTCPGTEWKQYAWSSVDMPKIVSLAVLVAGLYIVLSGNYPDDTQKWAFAAIGTILGFWLKE